MNSRSEMKRLAVQKPELLIEEIERLRDENAALQAGIDGAKTTADELRHRLLQYPEQDFERKYLRQYQQSEQLRVDLQLATKESLESRAEVERLQAECEQKVFDTDKLFEDNARMREALERIYRECPDNLFAAIADDALAPKSCIVSDNANNPGEE